MVVRFGLTTTTLLSLSVFADARGTHDQSLGRLSHLRSRQTPSVDNAFVTLPLNKVSAETKGSQHPQVLLQQSINQAVNRYNNFLPNLTPLTFDELLSKMKLRVEAILAEVNGDELDKRSVNFRNHPWTGDLQSWLDSFFPGGNDGSSTISSIDATSTSISSPSSSPSALVVDATPTLSDSASAPVSTAVQSSSGPASAPLDVIGRDVGYFTTINFGTPAVAFKILMDS
jgi:hypothetical protein